MRTNIFATILFMVWGFANAQPDKTNKYVPFVGKYDLGGRMIQFAVHRETLMLVVPGAPVQALEEIGKNKFRSKSYKDLLIVFVERIGDSMEVQITERQGNSFGKKIDDTTMLLSVVMDSLLVLKKTTEHFQFLYSPADAENADTIANDFERNYQRILDDLKQKAMPKVTVRIYPGLESFHKGINFPDAPNNILATAFGKDDLRMVSPANAGPESWMLLYVASHEFTHCVHLNIDYAPNNPTWLWEGLAQYEARWFFNPAELEFIRKREFPSFADLHNGLDYMLGYVIIEAIKDLWGFDAVLGLIKTRGDVTQIIKTDQASFERKIYEYIYSKYVTR